MSTKGLIMSLEGKQAVVLTSSGEFRKINIKKNSNPVVGDEIYLGSDSFFNNLTSTKWGLIAASILLILVLPMYWQFNSLNGQKQEVAYVNIDINPSIELAINEDNEVIKVRGLNNDGTHLLEKLSLVDTSVEQAVENITEKAEEKGYINPSKENLVVISLAAKEQIKDSAKYVALSSTLEQKVEKNFIDHKLNGHVETIKASAVMKKEAEELDLSVGKYAVLLSAWESGLKISADDIRSKSIAKALKAAGGDIGIVVGKAHDDQNLEELAVKYSSKVTKEKINKRVTKGITNNNKNKNKDQSLKIDEENEVDQPKTVNQKNIEKDDQEKQNENKNNEKDIKENEKGKSNKKSEEAKQTLSPVKGINILEGNTKKNSSSKVTNKAGKEVKNNNTSSTGTNTDEDESDTRAKADESNNDTKKSKDKKVKTPRPPSKPKVSKVLWPSKPNLK